VQSELYIKWTNSEANAVEQIELYNMNGQLMRRFENLKNEENTVVNFESYPSGYYILNLTYSNGEVKDLRIIKK
jgi:Secretion system C-terminal sorting domain